LARSLPLGLALRAFRCAKSLSELPKLIQSHVMVKPGLGVRSPLDG
jgi:hypothetical protein